MKARYATNESSAVGCLRIPYRRGRLKMLDMSEDFLGVSLAQINAITGRQILDVKITVARPRLRGHPHEMSQHVRQRIAFWGAGPQLRPAFRSSCRTRQRHDRRMLPCGHENPRSRVPWPQRQIETFEPVSHPLTDGGSLGATAAVVTPGFIDGLRGSVLLLRINARQLLFGTAASNSQAHVSCEDAGSNNKQQTRRFPICSRHLQTLTDPR